MEVWENMELRRNKHLFKPGLSLHIHDASARPGGRGKVTLKLLAVVEDIGRRGGTFFCEGRRVSWGCETQSG